MSEQADNTGWVVAIITATLGALGTLYGFVMRTKGERERTVIDGYRGFIADQREENQKLRERLLMHDAHMDQQQSLIEELYRRELDCREHFLVIWQRAQTAGVDLGALPAALAAPAMSLAEFQMNTSKQNTGLLKEMDNKSLSVPQPKPPKG